MLFMLFLITNSALITGYEDCFNNKPLKYHLIEKCHRSKLGIAAYANFTSITGCQRLGLEKRGLAINFSPPEAREDDMDQYTCEVLRCAESEGGSSLVNDTRFDYYSLYARPIPIENATCVPATGMFHLLPNLLNYTEAARECMNLSGNLADIITEQRTEALAQVLANASVNEAFVGMTRHNTSVFRSDNGNSLDCTTYRAWAPGHPWRNFYEYDCMLITRQKTWKTTPCSSRRRALCELVPNGPYKRGSIFLSRNRTETLTQKNSTEISTAMALFK
ncbi:uncharacterized protein LOC115445987 [Manduca sexta]|uniref:C-type lectin domain-containing protein n=1 Tax=Manduca sexta TaxID=7130 RepID=A0A922CQD8_MANSE|nr:uncharacterized protein LOC115445987 [Manduca sexta]KAG6453993.1 hypothetical protein O3G_MSEX008450 [Manduca sexta]